MLGFINERSLETHDRLKENKERKENTVTELGKETIQRELSA